jgi:plastocyanin
MNRWTFVALPALALGVAAFTGPAPTASPPPATIRIRMIQQGTRYLYEPANFTVRPGDVVEFVNVSGFPHNVQFDPAKIPQGARAFLERAMTNRMGNTLGNQMMTRANEVYRINFAGAPTGTYDYFCLPHQALGMKGVITVATR